MLLWLVAKLCKRVAKLAPKWCLQLSSHQVFSAKQVYGRFVLWHVDGYMMIMVCTIVQKETKGWVVLAKSGRCAQCTVISVLSSNGKCLSMWASGTCAITTCLIFRSYADTAKVPSMWSCCLLWVTYSIDTMLNFWRNWQLLWLYFFSSQTTFMVSKRSVLDQSGKLPLLQIESARSIMKIGYLAQSSTLTIFMYRYLFQFVHILSYSINKV